MISSIAKHRISDKEPTEYKKSTLSVADFTYSLSTFIHEHFRGAIELSTDGLPFGSLSVCADGLAYFIRLLLTEIYGKYKVRAFIHCSQSTVELKIFHSERSVDFEYMIKVAEMSGFRLAENGDGCTLLVADVIPERRPVFYAISRFIFKKCLYSMIFDA